MLSNIKLLLNNSRKKECLTLIFKSTTALRSYHNSLNTINRSINYYCTDSNNFINNNNNNDNNIVTTDLIDENINTIAQKTSKLTSIEKNKERKRKQRELILKSIDKQPIIETSSDTPITKEDQFIETELTDKEQEILDLNRKLLANNRCSGCGCSLQCDHSNELGYIPKSVALRYLISKTSETTTDTKSSNKKKDKNKKINKDNDIDFEKDLDEYKVLSDEDIAKKNFDKFNSLNNKKKNQNEKETCQRCHMLKHYGKVVPIKIPINEFRQKLSAIKDMNCVVVKVVDIMDFNGTFVQNFRRIIGNNPVILVGNKMDVLPADIHRNRIEDWLRRESKQRGVAVSHVHLLSSVNRDGISRFIVELEKIRRGRDVFVVGCSNVGKSTFLNALVDEYREKVVFDKDGDKDGENDGNGDNSNQNQLSELDRATTSIFPGTTLNIISVPLWQNSTLFDTPGVDNPHQIIKLLRTDELKMVIPTKRIKPTIAHMIGGKSLFLGGLARIDYDGGLATFTIYASNHLPLHISKTEKADGLLERQRGKLLSPPLPTDQERFDSDQLKLNQVKRFTITPDKVDFKHTHSDLVVSGLGWIAIKPLSTSLQPIKITVHTPKDIDVSLREPLVPFTDTYNLIK